VGALDLGGASTQIAFEISEEVEDNVMELKLYGQTYRLYSQSFLCYGQDQFLKRLLAQLITVRLDTWKQRHVLLFWFLNCEDHTWTS